METISYEIGNSILFPPTRLHSYLTEGVSRFGHRGTKSVSFQISYKITYNYTKFMNESMVIRFLLH